MQHHLLPMVVEISHIGYACYLPMLILPVPQQPSPPSCTPSHLWHPWSALGRQLQVYLSPWEPYRHNYWAMLHTCSSLILILSLSFPPPFSSPSPSLMLPQPPSNWEQYHQQQICHSQPILAVHRARLQYPQR